ncbi:helix-turn-helix transcriptional regulator [Nocardia sp. NPDC051570]|uniref:helix-turn-helix transcriptional regulator n=1 Tax=Nocardia sp. NPDC051570 TaxID=3364324 RepID=UPI0037959773
MTTPAADDPSRWWTSQQCADYLKVKVTTWNSYVNRPTKSHPAPKPIRYIGNKPVWDSLEVIEWDKTRPGSPISA